MFDARNHEQECAISSASVFLFSCFTFSSSVLYSRVFVLEKTWKFRIQLSDCALIVQETDTNATLEVITELSDCLVAFGVAPEVLPTLANVENVTLNDSVRDTFLHTIVQPQSNVYYFISFRTKANYSMKLEIFLDGKCFQLIYNISTYF